VLGFRWWKVLAFPVGYFLVAVPWPTVMEAPLIQWLTRLDVYVTVELLGWFGVPALQHGNVIEVATGEIGIDEACSGIRSFQATLMLSLFLGERFRLTAARRLVLVLGGFALSFLFNVVRMFLLVCVAAHLGVAAIATWHDPTGITILLACFFGLLGQGLWMKNRSQKPEVRSQNLPNQSLSPRSGPLMLALCLWIVVCEILVEGWYRSHAARIPSAQQWIMTWPTNNPTFKELPLADRVRQILRYDEGRSAAWEENGVGWQAVFLRWDPGRTALHLAQNHTPAVCLTAAGHALSTITESEWIEASGLHLPFAVYEVTDMSQPVFVFYCLWDDRTSQQGFETMLLTYGNRLTPVLQGLRNPGQRSLELAVTGMADWLTNLPTGIQSQWPVRLAYVNYYYTEQDWTGLRSYTSGGNWGETDFLRAAFLSQAWSRLGDGLVADSVWQTAVGKAGGRFSALTALLDLSRRWQMNESAIDDLLWRIVQKYPRERWAQQDLERRYFVAGNTARLKQLFARELSFFPDDISLKNNLAATMLLLSDNLPRAFQLANDAYVRGPEDPVIVSTYAYSLHLQGRTQDGVAALEKLKPAALAEPSVALYYGVLLSALHETNQAAPFLAIAKTKGQLLPEEMRLLAATGISNSTQ